jgi:hypothetical protein
MKLSAFSSLASTAFDSARTNLKSMADAAAQAGAEQADSSAKKAESVVTEQPTVRKGVRLGTVLDSYA